MAADLGLNASIKACDLARSDSIACRGLLIQQSQVSAIYVPPAKVADGRRRSWTSLCLPACVTNTFLLTWILRFNANLLEWSPLDRIYLQLVKI